VHFHFFASQNCWPNVALKLARQRFLIWQLIWQPPKMQNDKWQLQLPLQLQLNLHIESFLDSTRNDLMHISWVCISPGAVGRTCSQFEAINLL